MVEYTGKDGRKWNLLDEHDNEAMLGERHSCGLAAGEITDLNMPTENYAGGVTLRTDTGHDTGGPLKYFDLRFVEVTK